MVVDLTTESCSISKVVFRFISKNFKLKSQTRKRKQQQDYSESGVYLLVIYFKSMYIAKVILSVALNAEIVEGVLMNGCEERHHRRVRY